MNNRILAEKDQRSCRDCGQYNTDDDNSIYMVTDEIWKKVVGSWNYKETLCIPCFEKMAGRRLELADLTMATANFVNPYTRKILEDAYHNMKLYQHKI